MNFATSHRSPLASAFLRLSLHAVFALAFLSAHAATITGSLLDIYGAGIDRTLKISPRSTPQSVTYNGTNYIVMDLAKTVATTNSRFSVNLLGGYYSVDFGTVNGTATAPITILVPPYDTNTYAFSTVATNLGGFMWAGWTNAYGWTPGTNITFTTNGASIAINAAGSSSIAATNVTGLGTAAYSNSTAFASSTVTNLTAGQLATVASALTNVACTNIWVTNGINAGSDSTGTYVRGGDGQPLNLSSGGIAYGYAYGGNGGTVNIAMGGYITNGGSGTSGPGDAGTVNIANGVYTAFLGGQVGLAGTVNIANGASGSGATGSAGTVNIATNNGNTYVGRLSAFGIISGNGSGLTNIASTNITGLGTAAYSNSTAFAASTVTNLTAGQLATIAAAVTNNASPTLTGLSVGAQTALDLNGNGKFGGVGHTNGVLTGDGSAMANVLLDKIPLISPTYGAWDSTYAAGIKVVPAAGGSQVGPIYVPTALFKPTTNSRIVMAMQYWATNGTTLQNAQTAFFMSNNVKQQIATTINISVTASNLVWVYSTNLIGNLTNCTGYNIWPYNNATTTFWIYPSSGYAFMIP